MKNQKIKFALTGLVLFFLTAAAAFAQTTAFAYQGKLTEAGNQPTANFQMEFKLFDAQSGGNPIGATIENVAVTVNQGVFNVLLDFEANVFTGANRFLEIAVRRNAKESYTVLTPRQQIASSPYSIRTLSAAQADVALDANRLGGVDASEYVTTTSVGNTFIRNSTTQQTADFNVSGDGIIGGNLGIGGINPEAGYKFDVNGAGVFRTGNGRINFGSPSGETGMAIISNSPNNRADVRFDGFTLKLNAGLNSTAPCCGIAINTAGNVGIGTINPQARLHVAGNAVQDRANGGFAKATLFVNEDGFILRCYNGVTGSSTGNCGFTVTGSDGFYTVNFGFQISDRFLSVTAQSPTTQIGVPPTPYGANFRFSSLPNSNPQQTTVYTFRADTGETAGVPFMLIVY